MTDIWQIIYKHLQKNNLEVYAPAQHEGECKKPYVVVKDNGASKFGAFSTASYLYDVLCYVPKNQYSKLEKYKETVKSLFVELQKDIMIRPTYFETPAFYDEQIKGYMVSIQYIVYKQIIK